MQSVTGCETGIWDCSLELFHRENEIPDSQRGEANFAQNSPALLVQSVRKSIGTVWLEKIDL